MLMLLFWFSKRIVGFIHFTGSSLHKFTMLFLLNLTMLFTCNEPSSTSYG